jgi:glutamate N-acetyltransferase/amino-acid N-acetyltransferase
VLFVVDRATVRVGGILLFENGLPHDEAAPKAAEMLRRDTVAIEVSLGAGDAAATIWGCDLSAEYVRINGEYRT